jgi:hypothetical protein
MNTLSYGWKIKPEKPLILDGEGVKISGFAVG